MAALFLLNVYYRDSRVEITNTPVTPSFVRIDDITCGSEIFSLKTRYVNFDFALFDIEGHVGRDEFVYLKILAKSSFDQVYKRQKELTEQKMKRILNNISIPPTIEDIVRAQNEDHGTSEDIEYWRQLGLSLINVELEVVLNKGQKLYETDGLELTLTVSTPPR